MTNSPAFWIGYIVLIFAFMYFIAIRPQQKEKKKMQELMASIAVGDSVLTSSGFYGVIIDMTDECAKAHSFLGEPGRNLRFLLRRCISSFVLKVFLQFFKFPRILRGNGGRVGVDPFFAEAAAFLSECGEEGFPFL